MAEIIERDPSLAAQVVSWASSSFYNAPGKIKSVHDAIIRVLGFDMVMNLAMGLALGKTLKVPQDQPAGYAPYWQQAMWMALGTTSLISKVEPKHRPSFGLSYLSGLLHNFGYLVLAHIFPPHFKLMCRYIEANRHLDTAYIEHFLLGITREQIGGQLMSVWNMPDEVITALRYQKSPGSADGHAQYASLLQLTHHLLAAEGLLPGGPQEIDENLYIQSSSGGFSLQRNIMYTPENKINKSNSLWTEIFSETRFIGFIKSINTPYTLPFYIVFIRK